MVNIEHEQSISVCACNVDERGYSQDANLERRRVAGLRKHWESALFQGESGQHSESGGLTVYQ